jgi:hypothetical protein
MTTTAQWFNVYDRIAAAAQGSEAQIAEINDLLFASIAPDLSDIASEIAKANQTTINNLLPNLRTQADAQKLIGEQVKAFVDSVAGPGVKGLTDVYDELVRMNVIETEMTHPLRAIGADALYHLAYGGGEPAGPINDAMIRLSRALDEILAEASPNMLGDAKTWLKGAAGWIPTLVSVAPLVIDLLSRTLPKELADKILNTIGVDFDYVKDGIGALSNAMSTPFDLLVATGLADFQATLLAGGPADPNTAPERAAHLLATAHRLGLAAHTIAAAAEAFTPLKALGFKEAAAAIGDLAGFKPISAKVAESFVTGAITRPMHYWGNAQFMPEMIPPNDLIEMVRKREMDLPTYNGILQFHGFRNEDRVLYEKTVWKEPTVRDLALALQDSTVDYAWILERVLRMGYNDEDAPRISRALFQRSQSSSRGKVISAATSAFANGEMSEDVLRGELSDLALQPETIELEIRAARLKEISDYTAQAISTYKKQYMAGVIDYGNFVLVLSSLGLNPDRVYLIAADADAQRLPKIQREEEAAVRDKMSEIRTNLVPRYRALFLLGAVTATQYEATLVAAGLDPQLAGQIVALDILRKRIG